MFGLGLGLFPNKGLGVSASLGFYHSPPSLTSTEFNKMPPLPSETFSSLHINIYSLPKHFDDLSEFLLTLNRSLSVIAVSETWLYYIGLILIYSISQAINLSLVTENIKRVAGLDSIYSLT